MINIFILLVIIIIFRLHYTSSVDFFPKNKQNGHLYKINIQNIIKYVDTRRMLHSNKRNHIHNISINSFLKELQNVSINNQLVTIIVPVYNASKTIFDTIGSLINQTYNQIEIIVINDASTDDSLYKLQQIDDPRLKIYNNNINCGTYISINIGLKLSSGKYILLQGSDDYSTIDRVQKMINILSNSNYKMCWSKWLRGKIVQKNSPGNFMFNRSILYDLGFFDNTRFGGDTEFIRRFKLRYKNKIYYINDILNIASIRKKSLTNSKQTAMNSSNRRNYLLTIYMYHNLIKKTNNYYMPFLYKKKIYKSYISKIKKTLQSCNSIKNDLYINNIGLIIK